MKDVLKLEIKQELVELLFDGDKNSALRRMIFISQLVQYRG